ncbi:hypothetical protein K8R33_00515 [archaeon]|nr:hypothetical protein [archaeon]
MSEESEELKRKIRMLMLLKKQKERGVVTASSYSPKQKGETLNRGSSGKPMIPFIFKSQPINFAQAKQLSPGRVERVPMHPNPAWQTVSQQANIIANSPEQASVKVSKGVNDGLKLINNSTKRRKK